MYRILIACCLIFALALPVAWAESDPKKVDHSMHGRKVSTEKSESAGIIISVSTDKPFHMGMPQQVKLTLKDGATGQPLSEQKLEEVHTQRLHLLTIDPTLTDYQHIHPTPTGKPGEWQYTWTPTLSGPYRYWADVTVGGEQQFIPFQMGAAPKDETYNVVREVNAQTLTRNGYRYELSFALQLDAQGQFAGYTTQPQVGRTSLGVVRIYNEKGEPVRNLQPVMGAFAHIVAFPEDLSYIVHAHPEGPEPQKDADLGGPELRFHLQPFKAGYMRIFVQTKIDGQDIFVPFGVNVVAPSPQGIHVHTHDEHGEHH